MSEINAETVWLVQEAHDKLETGLTHLKTVGRPEVTARIAVAREEGDPPENGGYHTAREEQGQTEGRIRQLEHLLRHARVGEAQGGPDEVNPGCIVTVAFFDDDDDTGTFLLGSGEILGTDSSVDQAVSPQSPLGAAVLDHCVGDEVGYVTPNGRTISVTIRKVTSWRDFSIQSRDQLGRHLGADLTGRHPCQDLFLWGGDFRFPLLDGAGLAGLWGSGLDAGTYTQFHQQRVEPDARRRIRDLEVPLHLAQVPAGSQEDS